MSQSIIGDDYIVPLHSHNSTIGRIAIGLDPGIRFHLPGDPWWWRIQPINSGIGICGTNCPTGTIYKCVPNAALCKKKCTKEIPLAGQSLVGRINNRFSICSKQEETFTHDIKLYDTISKKGEKEWWIDEGCFENCMNDKATWLCYCAVIGPDDPHPGY
jgi:hypothetical protein